MNLGPNDRDRLLRFGVIGGALLVVAIYGYIELRTPDAPPPAPATATVKTPVKTTSKTTTTGAPVSAGVMTKAAAAENSANKVGTTAAQYDPTLHMEAMLVTERLVYSGSGRNIFSATSAPPPVVIPKAVANVRTGVVLPVYTPPPGPPPLPPIDLKFFGTETMADGSRQAFLLHGDDVFLATPGSIVQRRYKVGTISAGSVEVEDMTNNNKQNLPLQKN